MPAASRAMSPSLIDMLPHLTRTRPPSSSRSLAGVPAGESAVTHWNVGGVAGDHLYVRRRDGELIGGNLGQHGGGALPPGGGPGGHRDGALPADPHQAGLQGPTPPALGAVGAARAETASATPAPGRAGGRAVTTDGHGHQCL